MLLLAPISAVVLSAVAEVHHLISANRYTPPKFHSIEFDDETNTLTLLQTVESNNSHVWISFSHDENTIYGSSMESNRLASYDAATLEVTGVVETSGSCEGQNSAFHVAMRNAPYYVISGSYGDGCGMSVATAADGSFVRVESSWSYEDVSSIHGLAVQEVNGTVLLYTADMGTDAIWVHEIDELGVAQVLQQEGLQGDTLKPRHLILHPRGTYVYASLEATNSLLALELDQSGLIAERRDTERFPVLPEDRDNSQYWVIGNCIQLCYCGAMER
ncbi:uncharacterized protein DNG_09177 [Cephalotrichum gorgonifer]|uniref:Carboxy-cis,cis-muconate cyclase n=1 Tax=Cephalotrichum gorgonifer TaxID=2041049 RepID=A0AAE8N5C6_9PEZI|nr:uncharacterized protein DNG_09177 [Cephalotrichum gorgonifer]